MFSYLLYRLKFTFIYRPGPKQEFDKRELQCNHYKGIETVTPTRDKPLPTLRQVKIPWSPPSKTTEMYFTQYGPLIYTTEESIFPHLQRFLKTLPKWPW